MWQRNHKCSLEDKKLELRLGPPGEDSYNENSDFSNRPQKRNATSSVVGWPPIRSFRKNIASGSSSKVPTEVEDKVAFSKNVSNSCKGLFVKINMDGVPIGRKVDINAYDSYEKLSSAVDELFRGLLEDCCCGERDMKKQEEKDMKLGSLIGSGEYNLVYEDNEGDKMLVGDVPWNMFVSTVKRLRVSKSSDLPAFNIGRKKEKNIDTTTLALVMQTKD